MSGDGSVRGIVSLGSVMEDEFIEAFGQRWPTILRAIAVEDVRNEVYFAIRPGLISDPETGEGRYQPVRLAVEPAGKVSLASARARVPSHSWRDDAMPVML
jgi:hypothetical protein